MLKVAWIYALPFLFSIFLPLFALEMNIHEKAGRHVDNDHNNWKKKKHYNHSMMMVGKNEQQRFFFNL